MEPFLIERFCFKDYIVISESTYTDVKYISQSRTLFSVEKLNPDA